MSGLTGTRRRLWLLAALMALTWLYFGGIRNLANTKDSPPLRAKELASSSDPQLLKYQASSSSETWSYDAKPDGNDDISATIGRTDSGTSLDERASKPDDSKSTTDWINAGVDLQCLMRRSPNEANRYFRDSMGNDQSIVNPYQYSNIQNLDPHGGWRRDAHQPSAPGLLESYAPCLESLNAPAPWPADSSIRYTNVGFQRSDGTMSGTESYYYNSYNADSGVIASWMIYSPEYFMQTWHNAGNHPELPEIRRWSDVAWIEWVHQCGGETNKIRNIKAFILHDINSRYWKDMVKSKHFNRRRQEWAFPTWDQSQPISIASDLGSELLASPLGRGVCWFLISNKAVLGRKQVSLIRVFRGEHTAASTNTASMLLYVDDADNVSTEPQYTDGKGCCDIM